jgi:hypothetical protein
MSTSSALKKEAGMDERRSWHSFFYDWAYTDFATSAPPCAIGSTYWIAVAGNVIYRICLIVFWASLNVFAVPFGVFVEPLWCKSASFRRLQFPGSIPAISVLLPVLGAYAVYCTGKTYGLWHVFLPFVATTLGGLSLICLLVFLNFFQKREQVLRRSPKPTQG